MDSEDLRGFCSAMGIAFREGESLRRHTSLKIGGPAAVTLFPSEDTLADLVAFLDRRGEGFAVLGRGTNVLIDDGGIDGAVIFTHRLDRMRLDESAGLVQAQSGCPLPRLIRLSLEEGLSGMEGLSGIPGSVGGAVAGNAGSFGYEMKDLVVDITLVAAGGRRVTIPASQVGFGYRRTSLPEGSVITGATLALKRGDPTEVRRRIRTFILEKRVRQPLGQPSAGCVFKNNGAAPAGRLIDEAGCKGMRAGGVEVSRLHANYFINRGGGTAEDFLRLMERVAGRVRERFGIILEPEIRIMRGRRVPCRAFDLSGPVGLP